jgi:glycine/D-amino acid oxidase-like deaminating enzyme
MVQSPDEPAASLRARDLARGAFSDLAGLKFAPYWWEGALRPAALIASPPPSKTDVAIVGSGYAGLSAALTLLRGGREVVVLERDVPGFGASTRNGGQVGSGAQKFAIDKLIEIRGREKALAMLHESLRMLEYLKDLIQTQGIACHLTRNGRFRGAVRPEHYESMAREMEVQKRVLGVESYLVPHHDVRKEIATDVFFGGSVLPDDGSLHPGLYHAGLMRAVLEAGGRVCGHAGVTRIENREPGFLVRSAAGDVLCRNVIVATNGYTDGPVAWLTRRIVPVGSCMIATGELPRELLQRLMPTGRVYGTTFRLYSYYRLAPDAPRIIWGGRLGRFASPHSPAAYAHLAAEMVRVLPELGDAPITHAWRGFMGYTHDDIPHLGQTPEGLHYVIGCNGTAGITRSSYFGHKIALKVLGDPEGATAWDDLSFPAFRAAPVARRMVPVFEAWYALRDRYNF